MVLLSLLVAIVDYVVERVLTGLRAYGCRPAYCLALLLVAIGGVGSLAGWATMSLAATVLDAGVPLTAVSTWLLSYWALSLGSWLLLVTPAALLRPLLINLYSLSRRGLAAQPGQARV